MQNFTFKMDDLIEQYENLKLSAFDKVKQINSSIHNVTLGPNNNCKDFEKISVHKEKQQHKKLKPKSTMYTREPVHDLRILLKMKELERLEKVQEAIAQRRKLIVEQQKIHENQMRDRWEQKRKELLLQVQRQELQILQAEEEQNKNFQIQSEQRQIYYQELEERRRKRDLELQAKEQTKRNLEYMNRITKNQQEISALYQDILNMLKTTIMDEIIKKPIGEVSQKLKALSLNMDEIARKSKMNVSPVEVQKSSELVEQMIVLKDEVQKIIIEHNKQREIKLKEDQMRKIKEATPSTSAIPSTSKQPDPPPTEIASPAKIDKFVSKGSLSFYSELQEFLQNYEKTYAELLGNEALKQFKFDCKKAVNIPVNAISAVNPQHLLDKYVKLSNLLVGNPVPIGDFKMSAKSHPQGIAFCTDLLAKKFILQGDLMISSNPEAAFCYATVIISLWNEFPEFGKLLLAHFHKQCPYLVPIHMPKSVGQSDEDYYKSLGYQYSNGVVEKHDKYLKRMTGIMRLYAAIIIGKPKKSQNGHNPHGLLQGWRWLTATLNLEPKSDITASLIHVFLETVGATMQSTYKKEFTKIIRFIISVYMPMLKKVDSGGPYTRLEVLLQEYEQRGYFPAPIGTLSPNFW